MPQIPDALSSQPYAVTAAPTAPVDMLTHADDILTKGLADVSSNFAALSARMAESKSQSEAAGYSAQIGTDFADLREKFARDPDPATAPERFKTAALAYRDALLGGIADDTTKFYVAKHISLHIPTTYAEVAHASAGRVLVDAQSKLTDAASQQAQTLAGAPNAADEQLALTALKASLAGGVHAGTIDQGTANRVLSLSLRQAATIRGTNDPAGASGFVDRYAADMQAGDVAEIRQHLHGPLMTQAAIVPAAQVITAAGDATQRAQAVHDGFVARHYSEEDAWALAANAMHESGGDPAVKSGDGGISHGLFQWNHGRLAAYQKQYGHLPEQGTLDEQLDFADSELKGSEATAAARVAATPATAGDRADAYSRFYIRPGDEEGQAAGRRATGTRLATFGAKPDLAAQLADVRQRTEGQPFEVQQHAQGLVIEAYHRAEAGLAPARGDLKQQLADQLAGYEAGVTDPEIPTQKITTLLPPAEAKEWLEKLRITRAAGTLFRQTQWATPADIQDARERLAVPGAFASSMPSRQGRHQLGAPADSSGPPDLSAQYNTQLSPEDEAAYQAWGVTQAKQNGGRNPAQDTRDYDMRGFWKSGASFADNGHAGDQFKKPNHPTFSDQSQYSTADNPGGHWTDEGNGKWSFNATAANLQGRRPDELRQYFADREQGNTVNLPATTDATPPTAQPESAEGMRIRLAVQAKHEQLLQARQRLLIEDPAGYVAIHPSMTALAQQIDPAKPETMQAYSRASIQLQSQLGVAKPQVLTGAQVADWSQKINSTDPAQGNMQQFGQQLEQQYGGLWPQVMGELVTRGKVSPDFQLLADMSGPGQAGGAADFQRMLVYREKKGGAETMAKDAPPDKIKTLNTDLDATLEPVRRAFSYNQGGMALISTVRDGIKNLATYYVIRGDDPDPALARAYDAIIGGKYDVSGTMLVDKTGADPAAVRAAAWSVQHNLSPDELATPPARANIPDESEADRRSMMHQAALRGFWVPNNGTTGLVLMGRMRNGDVEPILRANGRPVEIISRNLPSITPPVVGPAGL